MGQFLMEQLQNLEGGHRAMLYPNDGLHEEKYKFAS
jgi:hypothetical protein